MNESPITLKGENEEEIWSGLEKLWSEEDASMGDVQITLDQAGRKTQLYIVIDWGGGFEGSYELTRFSTETSHSLDLRFAIHDKDMLDSLGKFLGMEDKEIGYADFDEKLIIKTNNEDAIKNLFSDGSLRELFLTLKNYTLSFLAIDHDPSHKILTLEIEQGIVEISELRKVYNAFFAILLKLEQQHAYRE